jgi:hypothetical protein
LGLPTPFLHAPHKLGEIGVDAVAALALALLLLDLVRVVLFRFLRCGFFVGFGGGRALSFFPSARGGFSFARAKRPQKRGEKKKKGAREDLRQRRGQRPHNPSTHHRPPPSVQGLHHVPHFGVKLHVAALFVAQHDRVDQVEVEDGDHLLVGGLLF